jgi:hypothetical protein
VSSVHEHLVRRSTFRLQCSCSACAQLLAADGADYVRVPRRITKLDSLRMSETEWEALGIPIRLAFFVKRSAQGDQEEGVRAIYPSPAGPTVAGVPVEAWAAIASANPILQDLQTDVEALLVHRLRSPPESYVAPIDECYRLVGLLRAEPRGFSGSDSLRVVDQFLQQLAERAESPLGSVSHA